MSETAVNLTIDPKTVHDIVSAQIKAAVALSLSTHSKQFIEEIVKKTIELRVNSEGKHDSYEGYNTMSYIEWASHNCLKGAVKSEIEAWIKDNHEIIRRAINTKLSQSKNSMIKAMADNCVSSMMDGWNFKFSVGILREE